MRPIDEQKLKSGVQALKAGDKSTARDIFKEALRENPTLEDAWVGLYFCAETPEEGKSCLQRALGINPNHPYAHSTLARLEQTQPTTTPFQEKSTSAKKASTANQIFAAFLGIMLCVACLFGGLIFVQNQQKSPEVVLAKGKLQFIEFYADW